MPKPPANDDEELVYGVLDCSFDELISALRGRGAEVDVGLLNTESRTFLVVAND